MSRHETVPSGFVTVSEVACAQAVKFVEASGLLIPWNWGGPDRLVDEPQVRAGEARLGRGQPGAEMLQGRVVDRVAQPVEPHRQGLAGRVRTQIRRAASPLPPPRPRVGGARQFFPRPLHTSAVSAR